MAALGVGAKLDLVHRDEIGAHALGHRLDRADPVLRAVGHDPLLAGEQRHHRGAARGPDPVIDLARQQAQRQPDDAAAIAQHPLDGEMGLAGVRRPQDREDP